MSTYDEYMLLIRPEWAPPAYVFGPVWSVLYVLIAFSFCKVFIMAFEREIPLKVVLPFVLNLFFNFSFTFLQFALRNNVLAALDILLVLATLVWAMMEIYPYKKWVTYFQIPYLAWIIFATILQFTITYLNI